MRALGDVRSAVSEVDVGQVWEIELRFGLTIVALILEASHDRVSALMLDSSYSALVSGSVHELNWRWFDLEWSRGGSKRLT